MKVQVDSKTKEIEKRDMIWAACKQKIKSIRRNLSDSKKNTLLYLLEGMSKKHPVIPSRRYEQKHPVLEGMRTTPCWSPGTQASPRGECEAFPAPCLFFTIINGWHEEEFGSHFVKNFSGRQHPFRWKQKCQFMPAAAGRLRNIKTQHISEKWLLTLFATFVESSSCLKMRCMIITRASTMK